MVVGAAKECEVDVVPHDVVGSCGRHFESGDGNAIRVGQGRSCGKPIGVVDEGGAGDSGDGDVGGGWKCVGGNWGGGGVDGFCVGAG